jgi:predicted nucleotidyltransferase component of viral defense system
MNLHENAPLFDETIYMASQYLSIFPAYIEKDYWITRALQRMAMNPNSKKVVFKGGTSLAKAYQLTHRFSEDIDVAVIEADSFSGNQLKMLIKRMSKDMAYGLEEVVVPKETSKGSRFYKAFYKYPSITSDITDKTETAVNVGRLQVEINTYANPYPYVRKYMNSFITDFYQQTGNEALMKQYGMEPFELNVLDKRRTLVEKLVSLFRFSFNARPSEALSAKVRHFYDLYFLSQDAECITYMHSNDFYKDFSELFAHDQSEFDTPDGWRAKSISESPLITDFPSIWKNIISQYMLQLGKLAYINIPEEGLIEEANLSIFSLINHVAK